MPTEIPGAIADATTKIGNLKHQTFRNWTVKETTINTIVPVGLEIFCWFFIGECIGKGSVIGYQVPHHQCCGSGSVAFLDPDPYVVHGSGSSH